MGTLYVVATPIGNLEDITFRAIEVLKNVDLIACEDTRRTKILFQRYQFSKPVVSFHQHSRLQKIDYLLSILLQGKNVALVTDAGTPNIDDPGGILVEKAYLAGIKVVPIPGPSALTAFLSVCGFSASRFLFLGFLPKKKKRKSLLQNLYYVAKAIDVDVLVLFESPFRILKTLEDLKKIFGNCEIAVGRELTKKFEEIYRGKISEAIAYYTKKKPKGEFVICLKI